MSPKEPRILLGALSDTLLRLYSPYGLLLALILSAGIGLPLSGVPDYEIAATAKQSYRYCTDDNCFINYKIIIGNSGWHTVSWVKIALSDDVLKDLVSPLKVYAFGKVSYPFSTDNNGGSTITLSNILPRKWLEVTWTVQRAPSQEVTDPQELLTGIESAQGAVVNADPESLTFARFLTWLVT